MITTRMMTTIRTVLAALSLGSLACSPSLGNMTEGSDTGDDTGMTSNPTSGGGGSGGQWMPCSASNKCPEGEFCFNGVCAIGCNSDGDCASNQYCATDGDRLCHNKEVSTCPDVPCVEGQICVNGFCSTPPMETMCTPNVPDDGCAKDAICFEEEEGKPKCYTFPYCPEDGVCPIGAQGAVCNDGLIPEKDKICLVGACTDVGHCPADWKCVKFGGVIGACSSGVTGSPCTAGTDCVSGTCSMPFPGVPGFCG